MAPGAASAGIAAERKAGWSAAETLAIAITAATARAEIFIILKLGCTCARRSKLRYDDVLDIRLLYLHFAFHVGGIRSFS